jgi:error-prone DNA polymerase
MDQRTYVPLWVKSSGSFLEGASQPEELVSRAQELGLGAMALTDRDGVYGLVRAHMKAREAGVRIIVGAQASLLDDPARRGETSRDDDRRHVVLLAETREGYGALCRMLTVGHARAEKGVSRVSLDEVVAAAARGLVVLAHDPALLERLAAFEALDGRLYAMVTRHLRAEDCQRERALRLVALEHEVPTVAAVEVLYHQSDRRPLCDVLTCIRHGVKLGEAGTRLRANAENALASDEHMRELFADDLASLERTHEIADRCRFSLAELRYRYPAENVPEGSTEHGWLRELTYRGAEWRYAGPPPKDVRTQIERELTLIEVLEYGGYFLTMKEIVDFCGRSGILCQGRGSAANSVVCYCLGITAIDPVRMDLLFERFLSLERAEPPDIDLDIEHERREEVIQWLYERHGRRHAAMVANVVRYRAKSGVRDVGKTLGFDMTSLDRLSRLLSHYDSRVDPTAFESAGLDASSPLSTHLVSLVHAIQDYPRHLSIHPGGFLLGHEPVDEIVPVEPATMEGRTVIQWDKYDVDALGLFKVDLLGLGCLTHIRKTFQLLRDHRVADLDLAQIPTDDQPTFEMLTRADTVGVFQIESRAQMSMLPRLRPSKFYDLVIEVAIVRPGPIQGGMIHPYLRRRSGEEPVIYPHPVLRRALERTLGVPIFQEQVMKIAVLVAGYTGGESDQLRRDMAAWRSSGRIEAHRERLLAGMIGHGIDPEFADRVFQQIRGFGEYGFPESHAASFALLAYATGWLRKHHLAAFVCGLLNSQPMGFYSTSSIIEDAKHHGVTMRPIDAMASAWDCTLEPLPASLPGTNEATSFAVRMGYRYVLGLGKREREALEAAPPPYADLDDFVRRTRLSKKHLIALAELGAFDGFETDRRTASWAVRGLVVKREETLRAPPSPTGPAFRIPTLDEEIIWDYERASHSTRGHPLSSLRDGLRERGLPDSHEVRLLPDGARTDYVGLVICRQRPGTASGITFYTLEDEAGFVNVVVFRQIFEAQSVLATTASLLGVHGRIQTQSGVTHLIAESLFAPEERLAVVRKSRDFH